MNKALTALALATTIATFPAQAKDGGEAEIRASAHQWVVNFEAGDLAGLMTLYMPQARVALHGQTIRIGKAAIAASATIDFTSAAALTPYWPSAPP